MEMNNCVRPPAGASKEIANSVEVFARWLELTGYESYDPYDVWGTSYGLNSRRLYYRAPALGIPLIAPVLLMEMICPKLRRLVVKKRRFATAEAQLALAFLNLFQASGVAIHLEKATSNCETLIRLSLPGYSGNCWGYPFDWQNSEGLWKKDTPFITATPYCYEAFASLGKITKEEKYFLLARSIAKFVHDDLNDTPTSQTAAAASYSPFVHDRVINASAYRAFVLFDAARRFDLSRYREKATMNLQFILDEQRSDGSWLYAAGTQGDSFIDHFHTCFVLKNLFKINRDVDDKAVRQALHGGYAYYRQNLFYADGLPKCFSKEPRMQITQLEMYDVAEAITLGVLLKDEIPAAYQLACSLAFRACREFQLPDGHFVTRVYRGGIRHTTPFLRWPQAQLFYALTNVLASLGGSSAAEATPRAHSSEHETAMSARELGAA